MKKMKLLVAALGLSGILLCTQTVGAEELSSIDNTFSGLQSRATPIIKEVTLESGESESVSATLISNSMYFSKHLFQVEVASKTWETFLLETTTDIGGEVDHREVYLYGVSVNGGGHLQYYNLTGTHIGRETIKITNYSAGPVKYRIGLNTGLHFRDTPQVDLSDLEFDL